MTVFSKCLMVTKFLCLTFVLNGSCQIEISNISEIDKLKRGTTYIAMKDPLSEKALEYINVFKANWTISKFEFIKYTDIEKYLSPENSFLTVGGYAASTQFVNLYSGGVRTYGIDYTITHIYLELWTCDEKYFASKKKNKKFDIEYQKRIARLELFTDFPTLSDPDKLFQTDYDANGHIRNWGPGILKNQIQALNYYINKNEKRSLYAEILNENEIKKLKKETLYVPDYVLIKFNPFTGNETESHNESDIFDDYKLKYKLIPIAELNQKILTDTSLFYYMIYIKSSTDKFVSVINSATGELIYSEYTPGSYNLKSGDLKRVSKMAEE